MTELSKKKKIKLVIAIILIIIFIGGLVYASYNIIIWNKDVNTNNAIKENINKSVKVIEDSNKHYIDFKGLKEQNNDTVAYIKVNNTNIDYVVVKASNNKYYLNHDFNKEYNVAGWIFADYSNTFDGNDYNIVLYGHNTRDGSMFGSLKKTLESEWQSNKDNHEIVFVTENGEYRYKVFSTYIVDSEDYYIKTSFNSDGEYNKFLDIIKSRSNYNYKVNLSTEDKILTLSSCTSNGTKRVVLHAKLIQ